MFGTLSRRKRDGPLMIPSVMVVVTPLCFDHATSTNAYAVRVTHPAPCEMETDWMEFGLAHADDASSIDCSVEIASVSIDGMPVRFEINSATKHAEGSIVDLSSSLDKLGSKSWAAWARVHVGDLTGDVQIDYLVKAPTNGLRQGKGKAKNDGYVGILLPTFTIPVGKLEVNVDASTGKSNKYAYLDIYSLQYYRPRRTFFTLQPCSPTRISTGQQIGPLHIGRNVHPHTFLEGPASYAPFSHQRPVSGETASICDMDSARSSCSHGVT
jgi:hypothetical protein